MIVFFTISPLVVASVGNAELRGVGWASRDHICTYLCSYRVSERRETHRQRMI
jgi:hypothetical protein